MAMVACHTTKPVYTSLHEKAVDLNGMVVSYNLAITSLIVRAFSQRLPVQTENYQKWRLYKVRGLLFRPNCAKTERNGSLILRTATNQTLKPGKAWE